MKWFQMDCDAVDNPDIKLMIRVWGWDWWGRYVALLGKIGQRVTDKSQTFALQTNNGRPTPVEQLANDLGTTAKRLTRFCSFLAENHLIDADAWKTKKLIYAPKLAERADEYTKKLQRKSGQTPDNIRTDSGPRLEEEVDKKKLSHPPVSSSPQNGNRTSTPGWVLTDDGWKRDRRAAR